MYVCMYVVQALPILGVGCVDGVEGCVIMRIFIYYYLILQIIDRHYQIIASVYVLK
jgi:hypothetical protein